MAPGIRRALAWVPIFVDLPTHPKTLKVEELTGVPNVWPRIARAFMWVAADMARAETGDFTGVPSRIIEALEPDWPKRAKMPLLDAMREAGFINPETGRVHEWELHAGAYFVRKADARERQRKHRRPEADRPPEPGRSPEADGCNGDNMCDVTVTSGVTSHTTSQHSHADASKIDKDKERDKEQEQEPCVPDASPAKAFSTASRQDTSPTESLEQQVFTAWHEAYAPKGFRKHPTISETDFILKPAIRQQGGDQDAVTLIVRSLKGHQYEPADRRFRSNPMNASLRTLESLLKPNAVTAGLALMDAHESGADKEFKKVDPLSRPQPPLVVFTPEPKDTRTPEERAAISRKARLDAGLDADLRRAS